MWSTTLTQPNRYISAHGIRGFAGGYSEDGLEFWSFPLQLVSGYHLSFVLPKAPSISANTLLTAVAIDPLGVTRIYVAPDFRIRERIATDAKDPGVLVRFTVEGRSDLHIQVHFQRSLNLMWSAGIGGQETSWDQDARFSTSSLAYERLWSSLANTHTNSDDVDEPRVNNPYYVSGARFSEIDVFVSLQSVMRFL